MRQGLLIVALACLLTCIPFIHQPYTIDGPTFVAVANHLREAPTRIVDFQYDHLGERVERYIIEMTHPPLWPYLLAGAYVLSVGESEEVSHLVTALMAALAGMGMFLLAGRLGAPPLFSALLLITTPAFLVLSHTVMSEVPSLAFTTLGVWLFLRYRERPGPGAGILAGLFLLFAVGVAYQSIIVLPALALSSPRSRWKPLSLPLAAVAAWWALPWAVGGESPLASGLAPYIGTVASNPVGWVPIKAACLLAYFGLCPAFLPALFPRLRSRRGQVATLILLLLGAVIYLLGEVGPGVFGTIFFGLLFAAGAWTVFLATRGGRKGGPDLSDPDSRLLLGWLGGGVLLCVFVLNFAAVRHTLLLLPPLILLLLRGSGANVASRWAIWASLTLGLLLSVADSRFAEAARSLSRDAMALPAASLPEARSFSGEWGFRHYREEEGLGYFLPDVYPPSPGERVMVPMETASPILPPDLSSRLTFLAEIPVPDPFPIRMMHSGVRAGFYCHAWGMLPFTISTRPIETLRLYEVNWFLSSIDEARIPDREGVNRHRPEARSIAVGGEARAALFLHPPGEIGFSRRLYHGGTLHFSVGIPEEAWQKGGDGATFEVSIIPWRIRSVAADLTTEPKVKLPVRGERVTVYTRHLDPANHSEDRGWQKEEVGLEPWEGSLVEIVFTTRGGPAGELSYDWAAWGDPHILHEGP